MGGLGAGTSPNSVSQTVPYLIVGPNPSEVLLDPRGYMAQLSYPLQPTPAEFPSTDYNEAAPGETFDYAIAGPQNGFAVLGFGSYVHPPLPTGIGGPQLDPQTFLAVANHQLDADGEVFGQLSVPPGVGSPLVYGLQSLMLSPTGEFGLTSATTFVLGWESTLSPY